ncbi:hypothetical protein [Patiriisocius marinus]|uniref:hypothetical protein n=1 Tax=Patiriisocius marinus TaxID=1397112 RepID=UPI00232E4A4C|nr:hypothetical protein [Patiriisocius marinus]
MDKTILDEIGFDTSSDFDGWHTNVYGAHKISKHFPSYIETKYTFDKSQNFSEYKLVNEYYEMADSLPKIKKFDDYLAYLSDKDVYIVVALKDAASKHLANKLEVLGATTNWDDNEKYSYVGLFNPAKNFSEELIKPHSINKKFPIKTNRPFSAEISSAAKISSDFSKITINQRGDILKNKVKRGLNFVIFNANMDSVLDVANFDTYKEANPERQ